MRIFTELFFLKVKGFMKRDNLLKKKKEVVREQ